ncbi:MULTISPECIES: hypothetical protein [Limosilactobacillus]|uniref:hypothetical protein n=1 Tax=Limosilactobacillus TaxID=2742598 RepID=UPI0024B926D3|nr:MULTISPECIES: hypothetical protein [Limosilactobacillus]MDM8220173.1 hypothetical protein [Limosilactobacillus mucosae]
MKKTRMMMFSLVLFGLLLVAVPAQAASINVTESTTSALSSLNSLPLAAAGDDGWAVLGALIVALPGAFYFGKKCDEKSRQVGETDNGDRMMLNYRGHQGTIEQMSGKPGLFGHVVGVRHLVLYEGRNFEELENDFHEAVDEYLAKY